MQLPYLMIGFSEDGDMNLSRITYVTEDQIGEALEEFHAENTSVAHARAYLLKKTRMDKINGVSVAASGLPWL